MAAPLSARAMIPIAAPKRVNILMVDDEPKNLQALEAVLESLGHNLIKAYSGMEALRCLMNDSFALILLDVSMPQMDGFETAALIRSRDKNRNTPIIFLTAVGKSEQEMFRGYGLGAMDYMLKPFNPEVLRYKISVLVDLHLKTEEIKGLNAELGERARELEEANASLKRLNSGLEGRVAERTAALHARSEELAASNQELKQFAAVASHDLQEPLRTIGIHLQMIESRNKGRLSAEDAEGIQVVLDSVRRMRQLIAELLAYSQVGVRPRRTDSVDCRQLVEEALRLLKAVIAETGATVEVGELPVVWGEGLLLGQVFQNLLSNALKFRGSGPPRVEVGATRKEGDWVFWVKDHGIGVNPEHFEKIFKIFRRLHTQTEYPGSGLGLSICKKIVERQGGRIWVESSPGQGATFYFSIPAKEAVHASLAN